MVRFSRTCLAAVLMCHPQVLEARKWMKDEEGNTLKSCDNHGGLKTLPRNAMECDRIQYGHDPDQSHPSYAEPTHSWWSSGVSLPQGCCVISEQWSERVSG